LVCNAARPSPARALLDLGISAADARLIIGENLSRLFAG
jgi:hypothetical protein